MSNIKRWALVAALMLLGVALLAACQPETITETIEVTRVITEQVEIEGETVEVTRVEVIEEVMVVTATPAPVEEDPKDLVICMAQEPETLYQYGGSTLVATAVRHAFYENLWTSLSYDYQAQGIEKIPSLADGDAVIESVEASAGAMVVDATGEVVELAEGVSVVNSDGETVAFDGTPVMMDQMTVRFTFKPLVWSDGTPVTADDSVYSYELAADPDTPASKFGIARTASYEALSDLEVQWMGILGWRDSTYFLNVYTPFPRHQLEGFTAAELLEAEETTRTPLANGAFVITEWVAGDHISLVPNEHYYRASEGLPYLDSLTYKFIPDTNQLIAQLLSGQCDIGTQDGLTASESPFLIEAENNGLLVPYFQTGTVYEHIDFNINPVEEYAATRPDWFEDVRVRQAMTMCTDRQGMVDNILYGRSEVIETYIPSVHPLYAADAVAYAFDPDTGNALLDEVGYVDSDGDGIREDPETGTPFAITLGTTAGNEMRQQLGQIFVENMAVCGIAVELYFEPAGEWFADGPASTLFGRQFDLGEFAWLTGVQPACNLYLTSEIPGLVREDGTQVGWGAANASGWSNAEYDSACQRALGSLPGEPEYDAAHKEAQEIFAANVPVIPLFLRLKVAAARPEVVNFGVDPTENSELWNIFEFDLDR